jgi:TPR repeat protein
MKYYRGDDGVLQDLEKARILFLEATEILLQEAYYLGNMYFYGLGVA